MPRAATGRTSRCPGSNAATGGPGVGLASPGAVAPVDSLYFARFDYDLDQLALFGEGP
jgi:hypothetical protein